MDTGVNKNLKGYYKSLLVSKIVQTIDVGQSVLAAEIARKVNKSWEYEIQPASALDDVLLLPCMDTAAFNTSVDMDQEEPTVDELTDAEVVGAATKAAGEDTMNSLTDRMT
ncbi:UNVERIFIED_CONTAM: hypothetical protein FKN15_024511 [Acipenser sinensis]